jgi:hypothetical protein
VNSPVAAKADFLEENPLDSCGSVYTNPENAIARVWRRDEHPFSRIEKLDKPAVLVFPKLVVCSDRGSTEFTLAETELRVLGEDA